MFRFGLRVDGFSDADGHSYRRLFISIISTSFSRNFSIFQIFMIFFPKYVKFNKIDYFASGEFLSRVVTERLRILIHISNYIQTLEIMEKALSDKNEPDSDLDDEKMIFQHRPNYQLD